MLLGVVPALVLANGDPCMTVVSVSVILVVAFLVLKGMMKMDEDAAKKRRR